MKIVSFNVGLLVYDLVKIPFFKTTPYVEDRLKALPEALIKVNADLIALQEIYCVDHKQFLCREVIERYPYIHYVHKGFRISMENGLMFLSKTPLNSVKQINFKNIRLEEYLFAQTGYSKFELHRNDKKFFVYNIHFTAGGILGPEHKRSDKLRGHQIEQLLKDISSDNCDGHILIGDFNCGPSVSEINYNALIAAGFKNISSNALTWDPKNPLNSNGIHKYCPPQSIDHIMLNFECEHETKVCFDKANIKSSIGNITLSDHYGIESFLNI
jgi:endonuclease/exonuclease/phosphatase family metal-dependent hydrolase